jgi:hypothetical protein
MWSTGSPVIDVPKPVNILNFIWYTKNLFKFYFEKNIRTLLGKLLPLIPWYVPQFSSIPLGFSEFPLPGKRRGTVPFLFSSLSQPVVDPKYRMCQF